MVIFLGKITNFGRILAMITRIQLEIEGKSRISAFKFQYNANILAMALQHGVSCHPLAPPAFLPATSVLKPNPTPSSNERIPAYPISPCS